MTTPQGPEDRDNKPADSSGSSDYSGAHGSASGSSDNLSGNSGASSQPNPYTNYDAGQAANNFGSNGGSSSYGSPEGSLNDAQTSATNAFTGGNGGFDQTAYQNAYNGGGFDQSVNSHDATSTYNNANQAYNGANNAYNAYNQAYNQAGFGAYPAGQQAQAQHGTNQDSFFKSLFDFSFTKYVTPSVVKVIYALLFVLVALMSIVGLFLILASLTQDGGIFVFIVGLPVIIVGAVVTLAFYRVGLEVAVSLIRTSQSVQSIDQRQAQQEQQDSSGYTYGG
ncbi:DUF4282 domain-containing protein [Corynebacterium falsenii]|uniref:DUF4282 domain-containing protein n=1 Tax=Corynebacterium falsenii TaxID=108486 RepID=UPI00234D85E4|nr:DUF4282 domain-containing protein [Corynebacterium falsenii]MDC7103779.1 DUF4282 domain-containing protein [Corynebacterium falsenii]